MKRILVATTVLLFFGCSNDDDNTSQTLTNNIEVYNETQMENCLVLAIENGEDEAYLLNKKGERTHQWFFDTKIGHDLEILPDGKLLGMFKINAPEINFGGSGGTIKILNPNSTAHWQYTYASNNYITHHDVEMLPNGNVLFIAWERIDMETAILNGANAPDDIFVETLVEVNPTLNQIVWKWNSFDHIVQNINPSLATYGIINENPNLIDINYNISIGGGDIMHANGLDYDEENDIIYLSINNYSEIWVIDHSTTTEEAATNSGGNYNKGGDLIYRFGNPETYNSLGNRIFFNVHFPNLIEKNVPGKGNVLAFVNKDNNTEQSAVYEFEIPSTFNLLPNANNEPNIVWSFTDNNLYSRIISGAVRLNNGNTLICEGDYGFWEVTESKEVVWKYNSFGISFWRGYHYYYDDSEIINLDM
jgi:hypothetical protein